MKKQLLFILGSAALCFSSMAQEKTGRLIPCTTYDAMEEGFKANPSLKAQYDASQAQFEIDYQKEINKVKSTSKVAVPIYTVPVVFHIMGNLNISDQAFATLVTYINNDYSATGSDVSTINSTFAPLYVDAEIRFALAQKDPNGNCTNGVIRHPSDNMYWSQSSPAYNYSGTGTNRWPTNKYLNIYIVECISSATYSCPVTSGAYIGGYTYLPGGTPYTANGNMGDAIVMLRNQVAVTGPTDSRTLSHEIGHWLNLSHTFGSTNNPKFDPSNMPTAPVTCGTDNVADTPPTGGYFSICTPSSLDCSSPPNIENIMDYASCPKMFTQGQITRMRTALTGTTGGRNNLWSSANLLATGITPGYTCAPVANFAANKLINCAGNTFTYTSTSQVGASGGVSWTFQGGTPATSTSTSQVVTYAAAGIYSVSLTATNTAGTNTMNKTSYINVVNGAGGVLAPVMYDFDAATLPSNISIINNNVGSIAWAQKTTNGANTTAKSIHLNNAATTNIAGHIDIFETPIYDFSATTGISMSFYYAYAKKVATQVDTFRIQYSLDCGGTWSALLASPSTAVMAAASGGTLSTAFNPTSTQWIFKSIPSSVTTALNNKPSVKFRFYFRVDPTKTTANNMYLDQINITGNVVTGITELEKTMALAIYPNPTSSTSTLDFTINANEKAKITLVDMMGRVLEESSVIADNDGRVNHTINTTGRVASGVYIVNIDVNNQRVSKKLIVE
jgi:PKD repeat protein